MNNAGLKSFYNGVSIFFLVLTVLVCLVTTLWLVNKDSVPSFLANPTDIPLQPTLTFSTWTPSPVPSNTPTPRATWTPIPTPG